ncbi:DotU family type IV/VI secretion system protein [Planctellipticum variicoloris]|uniref:DotU family type IV/VI secretion system protein n=1 Tax=Planctellipticum variicoloris TaxID=3064265 RepID=UPI002CC6A8A4|nr:DotU family type IV/VI secretion system protein [Planctomycetaceae bacterium SH412]HTN01362.1 DotU family type IV/VI secretion system protein [Planctomycetaceae bacterium]
MTPEFAQPVNRIFDSVLDLVDRIERHERPDLGEEKKLIRMDLDALMAGASSRPGQRGEDFELVRRALIYWVDEVLTAAAVDWKDMTLEFDYFAEKNRAWRFYEFGERAARSSSSDVIETWYLCLVLGFEGDLGEAFREHLHQPLPGNASNSSEARQAWADELARLIRKPSLPEFNGEPLSGGVEPLTGDTWLQTMAGGLFVASIAFVVLLAVYLKFRQS